MFTAAQLLENINQHISSISYSRNPKGLYDPIKYVLSLGGKRIRPVLMLMSYNLYRDDISSIYNLATGIEVYHNYTLLHDDVMDCADVRRGKPTVHKVWNDNVAILSGDAMLVLAYQYMSSCMPEHLKEVMDLFNLTALEICEGQQLDMEFESRSDVSEMEYLEMIRLKTAVLLATSLKIGAILGGAPADDAEHLYQFGMQIGIAFQLSCPGKSLSHSPPLQCHCLRKNDTVAQDAPPARYPPQQKKPPLCRCPQTDKRSPLWAHGLGPFHLEEQNPATASYQNDIEPVFHKGSPQLNVVRNQNQMPSPPRR